MDERAKALREIDDALKQEGFQRDWESPLTPKYKGHLKAGGSSIHATIDIADLEFVRVPAIHITLPNSMGTRNLPHVIGRTGFLCYLDPTSTVLDRYNPGGTILWCLQRARTVLDDAIRGKLDLDFSAEFQAYWRGNTGYIDLPKDYDGNDVVVYWLSLKEKEPDVRNAVIARKGFLAAALLKRHCGISPISEPEFETCTLMRVDTALTVPGTARIWPPESLLDFIEWIQEFEPKAQEVIKRALSKGMDRWWILIRAPNGSFLVRIELPSAYKKPEFTKSRRKELPDLLLKIAPTVKITRVTGSPIDRDYVFGRALHQMKGLDGKKILLIGCGTIGSFLSQYLAQSGAGTGPNGILRLADKDTLEAPNLGRHLLGIPYLSRNKAEACREFLTSQLPHLQIETIPGDILQFRGTLSRYDLVIDATGEEALSIALNDYAIRQRPKFPPILFVYLLGNGVAAQGILCEDKNFACYKCLKPDLGKPPRFQVVKEDPLLVRNLACGDATYTPFPVSRSVQAAALALEMALDCANGNPRPYFRTRVLDERRASSHPKDQNPPPSPHCPACSSQ